MNVKKFEANGPTPPPTTILAVGPGRVVKKVTRTNPDGSVTITETPMTLPPIPGEACYFVDPAAAATAAENLVKSAMSKVIDEAKAAALEALADGSLDSPQAAEEAIARLEGFKRQEDRDELDDEEYEPEPVYRPADVEKAEQTEREAEALRALEQSIAETTEMVERLVKAVEDGALQFKRDKTGVLRAVYDRRHPTTLEERPEFVFPDSEDGRAMSETSDEDEGEGDTTFTDIVFPSTPRTMHGPLDDEVIPGLAGRRKSVRKSTRKSTRGGRPILGPSRWRRDR